MKEKKVLRKVKQNKVDFISLQFADLLGIVKEVVIPSSKLENAFKNGVWFDGSSVEGFTRIQESDLFLKPNPSTFALIPWLKESGKTARMICDIYNAKGQPFKNDPRYLLKKVLKEAQEMGYRYMVGPEPEFYLFKDSKVEDGKDNKNPIDSSSYFDQSSYQGYQVVKEIIKALKAFGISVETSHHEVGDGQYEIDFDYGSALTVADQVLTLKYTVKKIAQMHELKATFMPKPIMNAPGSGMHVHQSLFDRSGKTNLFSDEDDNYRLSETAYNFIAGQMKHIKALSAIISPTVNSYKRLISGFEAPVYITWAAMNRSALIRIPKWQQANPKAARIELRSPDPSSNPYLAFAAMLKTGLEGVKTDLEPPKPTEENVYETSRQDLERNNIDLLPTSLVEALDELEDNEILKDFLSDSLFKKYLSMKRKEWDEFKTQVTSWELDKYSDIY